MTKETAPTADQGDEGQTPERTSCTTTIAERSASRSQVVDAAQDIVSREAISACCERRGEAIAKLIWNHADDREFLLTALTYEVMGDGADADGQPRIVGWDSYLVRGILHRLAEEIAYHFPDRPEFEEAAA